MSLLTEQAPPTAPRHDHIAYADAMRAVAISVVVLHHLVFMTRPQVGHHRPFEFGYLGVWGVNCFFVLSGFLLGRPYIHAFLDRRLPFPETRTFYTRRFLRIYPLYAVAIVLSVAAVGFTYHMLPSGLDVLTHLLMIHSFFTEYATSLNGPLWTMSVDAEFYVALPIAAGAFCWVIRSDDRRFRRTALFTTLAAVYVASICYHYALLVSEPATAVYFSSSVVLIRNLLGFSGTFALGLFLSTIDILYRDKLPSDQRIYGGLLSAGLIIALLQLTLRMGDPPHGQISDMRLLRLTFNESIAALSVSMVFFGLSFSNLNALRRLARTRAVKIFAALSYAIYLTHWPIIDGVSTLMHRPQGNIAFLQVGIVSAFAVAAVAYILHRFVERPFLRVKESMKDQLRLAPTQLANATLSVTSYTLDEDPRHPSIS